MKRLIFILLPLFSWAQSPTELAFEEFLQIVKNNHPLSMQAQLQTELGRQKILKSQGNADPKAFADLNQKQFSGTEYYNQLHTGLKIPTWFGVSFQAGYEQNSGVYLNPESNTPDAGLYYAGISLPLGKGLFMDERRATLKQARIFQEMTEAQQQQMLNELFLEAGSAYWEWYRAYLDVKVLNNAILLAEQRFEAVKQSAETGERPTIDTLEANIQWQNRSIQLQQSQLTLNNAKAQLAVFLWQEGNIPLELEENTIPGSSDIGLADMGSMENIDSLIISHPLFVQSQLKLNDLEVQRRLQSEMLKPELNLKYNALSGAAAYEDPLYNNNYTFGLQFSMPLFLRKERGDLRMTKVKLQQGTQDLDNKKAEINAKINMAMNELNTNRQLISLQEQTVENYNNLLIGEKSLFNGGESSLFMVNSREMNFIQSQLKLNALLSKQFIAQLKLAYALGTLNETI